MTPFEILIQELGDKMGLHLKPDAHESCKLLFSEGIAIQIDLSPTAESVLLGCEIGKLIPGAFRDKVFLQALKDNGSSKNPRGTLAFSEKKDELILFQFLPINNLKGESLHQFLQLFHEHAKTWLSALCRDEIPSLEESPAHSSSAMFGLR